MRSSLLARSLPLALAALLLAACGGGDDGAATPDTPETTTTAGAEPGPDDTTTAPPAGGPPGLDAAVDACALLDVDLLTSTVEFEFGESVWEEQPGRPGECAWFNESQVLTLRVSVWEPGVYDLDEQLADPASAATAEALAAPAGAVLWRDEATGSAWQVWLPAGDGVAHLVQDVLKLDDAALTALATTVAERL